MAIQKIMLDDKEIFIDDEVNPKETGIVINNDDIENTVVINPINMAELLEKTSLDIFGGNDE